jgi:hypothetical protein
MISADDIEAFREEDEAPVKVGDMATVIWSRYCLEQGVVLEVLNDGYVLLEGASCPGPLVSRWRAVYET